MSAANIGSFINCPRPRNVAFGTILDGLKKPVKVSVGSANTALPNFDHAPSGVQERVSIFFVTRNIFAEFLSPKLWPSLGERGISAVKVPMPKAAMYKNT